jgi:polyhydroxybutyrate depolymerase
MRTFFRGVALLCLGSGLVSGCTDDSGTGGTGGSGATGGEGGTGGAGGTASASPGCVDGTLDATVTEVDLMFDGVQRRYELHVPPAYDGSTPLPLVLNFHGFTSSAAQQRVFSEMDLTADSRGFVVAYPDGLDASWNAGVCCGTSARNGVDDVGFARAVIDDIAARGCIDRSRVYATGMSNGGFLSHRLACEASDLIAAIAPVAGVLGIDSSACTPSRPVPVVHFHGTADAVVQYDGGCDVCLSDSESVVDTIAGWVARNGCTEASEVVLRTGSVMCETTGGCDGEASVTLCTIAGGGHCWPGNLFCPFGESTDDISANEVMLDLFETVRLP